MASPTTCQTRRVPHLVASQWGKAQVILIRLEPLVLPGTAARKKSRILWNTEKEKRLIRLYEFSSVDSSRGCAMGLLGLWTLNYPEYPTTSDALLMKRMRLIKSTRDGNLWLASLSGVRREFSAKLSSSKGNWRRRSRHHVSERGEG